jgi:hypothetical protein
LFTANKTQEIFCCLCSKMFGFFLLKIQLWWGYFIWGTFYCVSKIKNHGTNHHILKNMPETQFLIFNLFQMRGRKQWTCVALPSYKNKLLIHMAVTKDKMIISEYC